MTHSQFLCARLQVCRVQWPVRAMTRSYVRHDSFIRVCWLAHTIDMDALYVWNDSFIYVWHDSFMRVTWLIHMCDMPRSYVWHDCCVRVTCLVHMHDMTHSYMWRVALTCMTSFVHMCDMTHSHVWHDSFICVTWLVLCVTWLIHMRDVTRSMRDMIHACVWQRAAEEISLKLWKALNNSCGLLVALEGKS